MQVHLLNFGDNTRVVNDMNNAAVSVGIGEVKECDIHDVHFHMIRRAIASETLLVVPKDVRKNERLTAIMSLMQELHTEPYDDVLAKYNVLEVAGEDEAPKIRPTRDQMRLTLRDLARQEVAIALKLQSKVNIREEGDAVTRDRDPKTIVVPPSETQQPKRVETPDAKDKAPRKASGSKKSKPAPGSSKLKAKRERL